MVLGVLIVVAIAALILEFFDASVGMGFGEISAILLLLGFTPLEVIPAVLLTSGILSFLTAILHHTFKNIDLRPKTKGFQLSSALVGFGLLGILIGVVVALNIPETILKIYIGLLVLVMGLIILFKKTKKNSFSWGKIATFGTIASFNKGMSGAGFGPILTSGQILSGVDSKTAVGATSITEGIISLVGVSVFFLLSNNSIFNWQLIGALFIGGIISTPIAVFFVKKFHPDKLRSAIGVISTILGLAILIQIFL